MEEEKNKMKIHPLTVCREKLQNNDFITTNYRKKAEMLEDIIAEEEELRNFAAEIYFEISNKILVRNSKRRKVLDCLKKLNLEYNYTSYVTDFDEINTMLEQFENRCQQLLEKKNDFSDAIENDYLNSRNILRNSIMDDTDIYNSISTVNPQIYEKMKWYLEGELRNNTETRKLELVLARIVRKNTGQSGVTDWLLLNKANQQITIRFCEKQFVPLITIFILVFQKHVVDSTGIDGAILRVPFRIITKSNQKQVQRCQALLPVDYHVFLNTGRHCLLRNIYYGANKVADLILFLHIDDIVPKANALFRFPTVVSLIYRNEKLLVSI